MIGIFEALRSLRPAAAFAVNDDTVEWLDTEQTQPTEAEIQAEITRLQAAYDAQAYARNRVKEYPSIGDQLDALWKGGEAAAAMLAQVQAVKAKYPKE